MIIIGVYFMINDNNSKHWKLGIFYYNPNNPAKFVSKRRGIGSTINFGSKIGRLMIGIMFAPIVLIILLFIVFGVFK